MWPKSLHMVKPAISLTHKLIHTVLSCERHAGEKSVVDSLLILVQTLSSVEHTLVQLYAFRAKLKSSSQSSYSVINDAAGVEITNIYALSGIENSADMSESEAAVCQRVGKLWMCLNVNFMKVYKQLVNKKSGKSRQKMIAVMNILQSRLQKLGCDFTPKKIKIKKSHQLYFSGLYLGAIESWKKEITEIISRGKDTKKVRKHFHSILYAYLLHKNICGVADFLSWLYLLSKSELFCSSSTKNHHNSAIARQTASHCDHGSEHVRILMNAVRQLIGTLGRLMAKVVLHREVHIPSPHSPHVCDAMWINTSKSKGMCAYSCCI